MLTVKSMKRLDTFDRSRQGDRQYYAKLSQHVRYLIIVYICSLAHLLLNFVTFDRQLYQRTQTRNRSPIWHPTNDRDYPTHARFMAIDISKYSRYLLTIPYPLKMTKLSPKKLKIPTWIGGEYVTYWGLIWATISLILYLNFSVVDPSTARPVWFILTTTGLKEIGLLISGCLCWRNWSSEDITGGRAVWLLLAIAIFAFFGGNLWFCLWEMLWGLDPAASAGNPFFVLFYLILIAGMRLAILDRDVQLARQQWVVVIGVAAMGLTMGCWLTTLSARAVTAPPIMGSMAIVQAAARGEMSAGISAPMVPLETVSQSTATAPERPPEWVLAIDRSMHPLVHTFNLFYMLCDLVLLTFAVMLFLGFWGGKLGLPWRMTAQAVLCFYIADTWFAYANDRVQGYESGSIMEVFWIFGIVQFGIAAALEFDNSIPARRLARRRTATK
jgi:hypothetical protein